MSTSRESGYTSLSSGRWPPTKMALKMMNLEQSYEENLTSHRLVAILTANWSTEIMNPEH